MKKYFYLGQKLFPITRSITGNGVRETLLIIKRYIKSLKIRKISSGTKVFDWKIPPEWNISDAYVIDKNSITNKNMNKRKNNSKVFFVSITSLLLFIKKSLIFLKKNFCEKNL